MPMQVVDRTSSDPALADLKFAQINLRHCKKATYTHCHGIRVEQTDVSLIQEPWIRGNKIHGFGQLHNRLLYCKTGVRPRAAIYVTPNVNAMMLNQFTTDDVVTMRVVRKDMDGGDFIVVSAYLPYDKNLPPPGPHLKKIVEFCEKEKIPMMIGRDSNSHHIIWSSSNINLRGEQLVQYLMKTDLMVMNSGRKPTFINGTRRECLDITIASCELSKQIHSWKVADEATFSDHRLIKFKLRGVFPLKEPYRNNRKTNWNLYRIWLSSKLKNLNHQDRYLSVEDLEKANSELTSAIVEAYKLSCPLIKPKSLGSSSVWSDDLERRKRDLRKAWNKAGKKGKDQEGNKNAYRTLLREYNRAQEELRENAKRGSLKKLTLFPLMPVSTKS